MTVQGSDNFADAPPLGVGETSAPTPTAGLTGEPDEFGLGRSAWWTVTPGSAGWLVLDGELSTATNPADVTVTVYTGTSIADMVYVGASSGSPSFAFEAAAGVTYHVSLDAFGSEEFDYVLRADTAAAEASWRNGQTYTYTVNQFNAVTWVSDVPAGFLQAPLRSESDGQVRSVRIFAPDGVNITETENADGFAYATGSTGAIEPETGAPFGWDAHMHRNVAAGGGDDSAFIDWRVVTTDGTLRYNVFDNDQWHPRDSWPANAVGIEYEDTVPTFSDGAVALDNGAPDDPTLPPDVRLYLNPPDATRPDMMFYPSSLAPLPQVVDGAMAIIPAADMPLPGADEYKLHLANHDAVTVNLPALHGYIAETWGVTNAEYTITVTFTVPRFRYVTTGPTATHAPPLRMFPRDDALGMASSARIFPRPSSTQGSNRMGSAGSYD